MCFLHFIFEKTTRPSVIQSEKITSLIKVTACFLCFAVTSERVCGRKSIQCMFKCTLSSTVCKDKVNDLELFMFASLQPPFLLFLCFNFAEPWLSEVSCFSTERVCADGRGRDEWFGDGRIRRMTICCCFVLSVKMISARFQIHLQLIYNVNESTWRTRWRNEYSCHYS